MLNNKKSEETNEGDEINKTTIKLNQICYKVKERDKVRECKTKLLQICQ